jgi:hypothetical protein
MERSKMNRIGFSYYRLGIGLTATLLVACGGSQPPGAMPHALAFEPARTIGRHMRAASSYRVLSDATKWFLYVGIQNALGGKQFEVYPLGARRPVREYGGTLGPVTMALDPWNDIYTTDNNPSGGQITAYTPGGRSILLEMYVYATRGLAFDPKGDLFATFYGYVAEYAPRSTKQIRTIPKAGAANALAFDSKGNLYVARGTGPSDSAVLVFSPGAKKPSRRVMAGLDWPVALLVDKSNHLYVANCASCDALPHRRGSVTEYAYGSSTPLRTITDGIDRPMAMVLDAKGQLFVANYGLGRGSVTVYAAGTTPVRKIIDDIRNPDALAMDPSDNLYVANCAYFKGRDSVTAFRPDGRRFLRITDGVNVCPLSIAIGKGS